MPRLDNSTLFKSVIYRTKVYFRRKQWRATVVFLFFVLLSAGFWYLQSLQEDAEMEIVLPVKYKNIPSNITLMDDNPKTIVFRVKDKGLVLMSYSWLNKFAPVEVNLKGYQEDGNREITVAKKTIESNIAKQLMASSSLLGFEPQSFQVHYAELCDKELPVIADVSVLPEPGFQQSDSLTVIPTHVRVYASCVLLDSLQALKTAPAELKKVNRTQKITLRLQKIPGVQMDEDEVNVTVPIEEFTEKRLMIPILCEDLPANYTLHTFPPTVEVVCNVSMSRFKILSESDFEIRIPFTKFEADRISGKLAVRLTKQPSWIAHPALNPDIVEFILEQNMNQ